MPLANLMIDLGTAVGSLLAAFAAGVGMALVQIIKTWWTGMRHTPVQLDVKKDLEIAALNREIRIALDASRIYVGLFSNGSHYYNKTEVKKYTWAYEDAALGLARVADRFQAVLTSLVPDEIALINDAGPAFTAVSELKEGRLQSTCRDLGVVAIARCAIRQGNDIVGFVGLDYVASDIQRDAAGKIIPPHRINDLPELAERMRGLVS